MHDGKCTCDVSRHHGPFHETLKHCTALIRETTTQHTTSAELNQPITHRNSERNVLAMMFLYHLFACLSMHDAWQCAPSPTNTVSPRSTQQSLQFGPAVSPTPVQGFYKPCEITIICYTELADTRTHTHITLHAVARPCCCHPAAGKTPNTPWEPYG